MTLSVLMHRSAAPTWLNLALGLLIAWSAGASLRGAEAPTEAGQLAATRTQPARLQAFRIDFNWGAGGPNGFAPPGLWADADPAQHVAWYAGLGANVIQTFAVSGNGYAWYRGGNVVPPQPGLAHDFLPRMVKLGHARGLKVMGYFCVAANTRWGQAHPDQSCGSPCDFHLPLTQDYLDFFCASIAEALQISGMDGFMIDWRWNPKRPQGTWLAGEQQAFAELMGKPFPGAAPLTDADRLAFDALVPPPASNQPSPAKP